jgi:hypothetical protein
MVDSNVKFYIKNISKNENVPDLINLVKLNY